MKMAPLSNSKRSSSFFAWETRSPRLSKSTPASPYPESTASSVAPRTLQSTSKGAAALAIEAPKISVQAANNSARSCFFIISSFRKIKLMVLRFSVNRPSPLEFAHWLLSGWIWPMFTTPCRPSTVIVLLQNKDRDGSAARPLF